jgi:hypothetical protein
MEGSNQLHDPSTLLPRNERQEAARKQEQICVFKNQQNGLTKIQ